MNEDLLHLSTKKTKSIAADSTGNSKITNRPSSCPGGGLFSLSGLPLLRKLPCRLQEDNHHCVLGESLCFFMAFRIYFPMYPNLITPVCVCVTAHIVAKISALIPSAKDSYLAPVSGGSRALFYTKRRLMNNRVIKMFPAAW